MQSSPLNVQLEHYEGPLDLLLDLIRKQEINIYDIPIAKITRQYLEFMARAVELNVELSSDFVYMAATLIHIKSKMLLPRDPELAKMAGEDASDDDPRRELVDRLIEHERFKQAAEMLQQKRMIEEAIWSNPQVKQFEAEAEPQALSVGLFDLVKVLQQILERTKARPVYEIGQEDVTVPQMIRLLRDELGADRTKVFSVRQMFEAQPTRRGMICLFLAILELVKSQAVQMTQDEMFGEIGLRASVDFDGALSSDAAVDALDEEYK